MKGSLDNHLKKEIKTLIIENCELDIDVNDIDDDLAIGTQCPQQPPFPLRVILFAFGEEMTHAVIGFYKDERQEVYKREKKTRKGL